MATASYTFALFFAVFVASLVNASVITCDVDDPDRVENIFDLTVLDAEAQALLEIIPPAQVVNDEYVRIIENGVGAASGGGDVGTFWFLERQRLGDGFIATFEFRINGPFAAKSDGFAFVAQNDKIQDIQGGNGDNLGYKSGLQKYIAVGFNNCADGAACTNASVEIGRSTTSHEDLGSSFLSGPLNSSEFRTATIIWLANVDTIQVEIDGVLVHTETGVGALTTLWGDEFAYFGITASSTYLSGTDVDIRGFRVDQLLSAVQVSQGVGQEVVIGTRATFILSVLDTCGEQLSYNDSLAIIANVSFIEATLTFDENENIVLSPVVINDLSNGKYEIQFDLPETSLGGWTLEVIYNGDTLAQGNPLAAALFTEKPVSRGISTTNLIILCCIIALLVLAIAYWIRRLYRYKKKLDSNKDNIQAGQTFAKIQEIEKEITYKMNPLLGTLDEMKERLERNKKLLERYNKGEGLDSQYTIEQLQEQNAKLREEMNRLKREEQEKAALQGNSVLKRNKKKNVTDFDQVEI
mmetsp:Transcript_15050/g.17034  ORF Transcript_15050/g.17034 Transcript_15050/m.17034 type:complete len:524 (-) Transcript_15050:164-1735(-)